MKHRLLSIQVIALLAGGFTVDASILERRIWSELRYQTVRYVSLIEPEARKVWDLLWRSIA
jgi:hypothetical protein